MRWIRGIVAAFLLVFSTASFADQNTLVTPGAPLPMSGLATFLNNGFTTVATNYSGPTPPAVCTGGTACIFQFWIDTSATPNVLRMYDGASWLSIGSVDTITHNYSCALEAGCLGGSQAGATANQIPIMNSGATAYIPRSVPIFSSAYMLCNGTDNDTAGWHAFRAAVLTNGMGIVQAGTCVVDDFDINPGVTLGSPNPVIRGSGINSTFIKWSSGHTAGQTFSTIGNGTYQLGLAITDLTFDGNASNNIGGGSCIDINTEFLVSFTNVGVSNCPESGIYVHGTAPDKFFGGLNIQGGYITGFAQNAGSTASGLKIGTYIYDVAGGGGTEISGGGTSATACLEINSPSNGVRISGFNIDCDAQQQVLVVAAASPTSVWTQIFGNYIHKGSVSNKGIKIVNSREVALSGNMFWNLDDNDIEIVDSQTIAVSGGTTRSSTSRTQSILLSGATTGIAVTSMAFEGTFTTAAIVEGAAGPDYNTYSALTVPTSKCPVLTGAHSKSSGIPGCADLNSNSKNLVVSGSAGAGYVNLAYQSVAPSTPSSSTNIYADASGLLSWIDGGGFTRSFNSALSANRIYGLQDASGTLAFTAGANIPSVAQGDTLYASAANVLSVLPKDTNATRAWCNTGTNNNPAWCQLPISNGISGLGTGIATALSVNVGSAGAPILFNGALGSPSSAGTLPAFTLGGAISGGGNQVNNVIIGASMPLAGTFTTLVATTAAPTVSASQIGYGGSTAAAANCNVTSPTPTGCVIINVAGTTRYIPYY